MKTYIFFALLIFGFFAIIIAIVRPEIIQNKYSEIRRPIDKYFTEKNNKAWNEAKLSERAMWMMKLKLPKDCYSPKSAIRDVECNNLMQIHAQAFEQIWSIKINSGWKPEGASN